MAEFEVNLGWVRTAEAAIPYGADDDAKLHFRGTFVPFLTNYL